MKKIVGVINARMQSTRLPGKALLPLAGKSSLFHHFERLSQVEDVSCIYLATSRAPENEPLIEEAKRIHMKVYEGAEEDLVERYLEIGRMEKADALIRCGCDKPLFSYELARIMVQDYVDEDLLYVPDSVPEGFNIEVVSTKGMVQTHRHYRGTAISQYMREQPHNFSLRPIGVDNLFHRPEYRFCLDTKEDYQFHSQVYDELYQGRPIDLKEVMLFLDDHPVIAKLNKVVKTKQVNTYVHELNSKPVFTIYMDRNGKYAISDRNGGFIAYNQFKEIVEDVKRWNNG